MSGQNAHVAFGAGQIDLIDVAGEQHAFRRDKFEMKRGHADSPANYAASAASFLPFSTASSMVPTM